MATASEAQKTNMLRLELIEFHSLDQLRVAAGPWDDLWLRSDVTDPTARAEIVAQWVERFAPQATFRALIVQRGGRFIAALPLVEAKVRGLIRAGHVPANHWCHGGGLLVAQDDQTDEALDLLVAGLRRLPWQLLWFDYVRLESPGYGALVCALVRAGMPHSMQWQYEVGLIPTCDDWRQYLAALSSSHRRNLRRGEQRLRALDPNWTFRCYSGRVADAEGLVSRAFQVEDLGWKGEAGSSSIRRGLLPFYRQQARVMAHWESFVMSFLEARDRLLAFQYGYVAKGVYHGMKTSYHPGYARLGPGRLVQSCLLQQLFSDPAVSAFDCLGGLTEALRAWQPRRYWVGRLSVAPRGLMGRLLEHVHARWWPTIRSVKSHLSARLPWRGRGPQKCQRPRPRQPGLTRDG